MWHMIYSRFGGNNQILVMKYTTLFTSYEFHLFIQLVIDGEIDCETEDGQSEDEKVTSVQTNPLEQHHDTRQPS